MGKETVNYEIQPDVEEFEHVHGQLLGAMRETFERLNAGNGEVVPITRDGVHGHFFYLATAEQTISEIRYSNRGTATPFGSRQQLSKNLLIETDRTRLDIDEKRLRYHQAGPEGIECVIDINPVGDLQYDSTSEIDALTTDLATVLEDLKLLERSH